MAQATFKPLEATSESLTKLLSSRPVLWVGAGTSIGAGYPSTWDLVKAMREKSLDEIAPDLTFTQVADQFVENNSASELSDLLQQHIGASHPPTPTLRAIALMAADNQFAAIITTNYDTLLERVLADAGVDFITQTFEQGFELNDDDQLRLLKIHGSREDWENTILSGKSYDAWKQRYQKLTAQLTQLLIQRRIVFIGCSMKDPRILEWIDDTDEGDLQKLKVWTPILTRSAWQSALDEPWNGGKAEATFGQLASVRPMLLDNHQQLETLMCETAPDPEDGTASLCLNIQHEDGWVARLSGCKDWSVELPADDDSWMQALRQLRKYDHTPVPTDENGTVIGAAVEVRATLVRCAQAVGKELTERFLSKEARRTIEAAIPAALAGQPAWLAVRVESPDDPDLQAEADRLLALPWELLVVGNEFPVEQGKLDVTREAVNAKHAGLQEATKPLSVVATVAAPIDSTTLDYETESYRLWKAMGATKQDQAIHFTDLGTLDAFVDDVKLHRPPIAHFTGHGMPGKLLFENLAAEGEAVPVEGVVRKLAGTDLRLMYLASCYGATPEARGRVSKPTDAGDAEDNPPADPGETTEPDTRDPRMVDTVLFEELPATSTAATLHRAGLPQVVAYFGPVGDEQSTRAEAEFYAHLATGKTARAAVRESRLVSARPVKQQGVPKYVYPLGWAQLSLYHRGDDVPTTLAIADQADLPSMLSANRQRRIERMEPSTEGTSERGVERLRFGFIGRRKPRTELYRRWKNGERLTIVQGLGGLGKTTLCTEMIPALCRISGHDSMLVLDGRAAGQAEDPTLHLWHQVQAAESDDEWNQTLAALQENGVSGSVVAQAILKLAERRNGLLVYVDDAESLQNPPGDSDFAMWRDEEIERWWSTVTAAIQPDGRLGLLVSCRYSVAATGSSSHLPLPAMPPGDTVKLLRWFPTLAQVPRDDQEWLANEIVDGHPRTVEFLEELATRRVARVTGPSGTYTGDNWRADILWRVLPATNSKIRADLLLPKLWDALDDDEEHHLGRCSVLTDPAPWAAIVMLGSTSSSDGASTAQPLIRAGLLSPTHIPGESNSWWAPHRLVTKFVQKQWGGDSTQANADLGSWYEQQFEATRTGVFALRAVDHLLAAGQANSAWPMARLLLLHLRGAGRYREALIWPQRILAHNPTGWQKGMALAFECQVGRLAGLLPENPEEKLTEAAELVNDEERSFVLDELAKVYHRFGDLLNARKSLEQSLQVEISVKGETHSGVAVTLAELAAVLQAQGDLAGARSRLERSLEIQAAVFGTEQHPDVGASLHQLAGVLQAQGDLAGARSRLERSLEIKAAVLGTEQHPDVAASLHQLAGVLQAQGDLAGARSRLERSLEIKAAVLGTEQHPDVASSVHSLAGVLRAQGDLAGARSHLERSLEIKAAVFGTEQHPAVASSLHELAGVLQAQGDLAGARFHLERSLEIKAAVFGTEQHPAVASSLHELAGVLQAQGDLVGARSHLERSLEIKAAVFGTEQHPAVAASLHSLAVVHHVQGETASAIGLLRRVLQIEEHLYGGRDHFTTAETELMLGQLLLVNGEAEEGVRLLMHALQVFYQSLGPQHPHTQQVMQILTQIKQMGESGDE